MESCTGRKVLYQYIEAHFSVFGGAFSFFSSRYQDSPARGHVLQVADLARVQAGVALHLQQKT
jgi:hypothetical protein